MPSISLRTPLDRHERTLAGVGNGLTAPVIQYGAYTAFAQENGLISQAEADRIQGYFPHCKWAIEYCNKYHGTLACTGAREYCVTAVFMQIMADSGNINYYDIRKECIGPDCYDFSKITKFLMQPHVRASASCIETLPRSQPVYPCPRAAVSCASGDASRLRDSARIAPRTLVLRPDVPTWCMLTWHVLMWRIWHGTCTAHGLPCTLLQQSDTAVHLLLPRQHLWYACRFRGLWAWRATSSTSARTLCTMTSRQTGCWMCVPRLPHARSTSAIPSVLIRVPTDSPADSPVISDCPAMSDRPALCDSPAAPDSPAASDTPAASDSPAMPDPPAMPDSSAMSNQKPCCRCRQSADSAAVRMSAPVRTGAVADARLGLA